MQVDSILFFANLCARQGKSYERSSEGGSLVKTRAVSIPSSWLTLTHGGSNFLKGGSPIMAS